MVCGTPRGIHNNPPALSVPGVRQAGTPSRRATR
jgi:hypothetical protein